MVWLTICLNKYENKKAKYQKLINEIQKKNKAKQKKLWSVLSSWKEWDMHKEEKIQKSTYRQKITHNYKILEFTEFCSG